MNLNLLFIAFLTLGVSSIAAQNVVGAIYALTNIPSGNYIIKHAIASDGTLTYGGITYAGGAGRDAKDSTVPKQRPDATYTQSIIVVKDNYLYTTNAGSNTVVMFEIDREDPTQLAMVGEPVASGGEWPNSVDISPNEEHLCVLNGGQDNSVQCFSIDKSLGLIALPNAHVNLHINQTDPPHGPPDSLTQVLFSSDGNHLLVPFKGSGYTPGYMEAWELSSNPTFTMKTPSIKTIPTYPAFFPFATVPFAGHPDLYVNSDITIGAAVYDYRKGYDQFANVTSLIIPGQNGSCWIRWSKATDNYYIADFARPAIWEIEVKLDYEGEGEVNMRNVAEWHFDKPKDFPIDIDVASVGGKDFLYVLNPGNLEIDVMALYGPGNASIIQRMPYAKNVRASGGAVDGNFNQGMAAYIISA